MTHEANRAFTRREYIAAGRGHESIPHFSAPPRLCISAKSDSTLNGPAINIHVNSTAHRLQPCNVVLMLQATLYSIIVDSRVRNQTVTTDTLSPMKKLRSEDRHEVQSSRPKVTFKFSNEYHTERKFLLSLDSITL